MCRKAKSLRDAVVLFLVAIAAAFVLAPVSAQTAAPPTVRLILFHSPDCPHCRIVLENILPQLQTTYGDRLEVKLYNLKVADDYWVFAALHSQYPDLPGGIPQAYIDRYVLVGSDQIPNELPGIIDGCLASGGCDWPFTLKDVEESPAGPAKTEDVRQPVYLAYCYDASCLECSRIRYDLDYLQTRYPHLVIREFNIRDDAALIEAMCEHYDVPDEQRLAAPAVFVGSAYLAKDDLSLDRLVRSIESADSSAAPPWDAVETGSLDAAAARITDRFQGFSAVTVGLAGLLDGLNPCAFTTLIFFVSYLALVGREKRDVLLVGAAFTLAVFLTYLAMGLGLSALVERLGAMSIIAKIIYGLTAVICLGLAALSLWDLRKIRRGQMGEILLQLPKSLKQRIHRTIRTHTRMRSYVAAAFSAGVLVSIFELACTGQVYLPTIIFMTGIESTRISALLYLVLYNVMFVAPLIVVFAVTYIGVSDKRLTAVFEQRAGLVKLFTAILFGVMGLWLGYMVLAV